MNKRGDIELVKLLAGLAIGALIVIGLIAGVQRIYDAVLGSTQKIEKFPSSGDFSVFVETLQKIKETNLEKSLPFHLNLLIHEAVFVFTPGSNKIEKEIKYFLSFSIPNGRKEFNLISKINIERPKDCSKNSQCICKCKININPIETPENQVSESIINFLKPGIEYEVQRSKGGVFKFSLDGITQNSLTFSKIAENEVSLRFEPNMLETTIKLEESKKLDLNNDNNNDLSITLDFISENKASVAIKRIFLPISIQPVKIEEKKSLSSEMIECKENSVSCFDLPTQPEINGGATIRFLLAEPNYNEEKISSQFTSKKDYNEPLFLATYFLNDPKLNNVQKEETFMKLVIFEDFAIKIVYETETGVFGSL